MTQQQVSDKSGVSLPTVNQVEVMKRAEPDISTLEKLAAALNSTVADMLVEGQRILEYDSTFIRTVLARNVRDLRLELGLSQADLATKSGLSISTIASVEKCRKAATVDALHALAMSLNTDVYVLFLHCTHQPSINIGEDS